MCDRFRNSRLCLWCLVLDHESEAVTDISPRIYNLQYFYHHLQCLGKGGTANELLKENYWASKPFLWYLIFNYQIGKKGIAQGQKKCFAWKLLVWLSRSFLFVLHTVVKLCWESWEQFYTSENFHCAVFNRPLCAFCRGQVSSISKT